MQAVSVTSPRTPARPRWIACLAALAGGLLLCSAGPLSAQTPTLDFTAERNYVHVDGGDALLPVAVIVDNPTGGTLSDVRFSIDMPAEVEVGSVDRECTESVNGGLRILSCRLPEVTAQSRTVVDFYIDGPNSNGVAPTITLNLTSPALAIVTPSSFEASLADGDTRIRGSSLTVQRLRNIDLDLDRNNIPDRDQAILGLAAGASTADYVSRAAVIDVLFVVSEPAATYLGDALHPRLQGLLTATNQLFRANGVAIKFHSVGVDASVYQSTSTPLASVLAAMQAGSDPALAGMGSLAARAGADLLVFVHAQNPGTDTVCGDATVNAVGRRGDFQPALHRGQLLSVVNLGPDCLGVQNLAPMFAANLGVVANRIDHPDGGTFSHSAGYGVLDQFATVSTQLNPVSRYGQAEVLEQFSNPAALCLGQPCGVERTDVARGADAVHSLNRTRFLVSALDTSAQSVGPDAIPDRATVSRAQSYALAIQHTATDSGALQNTFTEFTVALSNLSSTSLHDLELRLLHLNNGQLSTESQVYRMGDSRCEILGSTLGTTGTRVGDL